MQRRVSSVVMGMSCLAGLALVGCAHSARKADETKPELELKAVEVAAPVELRMKADPARVEKVNYTHRSSSKSYEDSEVRHQKEEALDFSAQAETVKKDPEQDRFVQVITVLKKEGNADLHDFAMPELGEKLEVTADSLGHILKSGDYPSNSIFFVPPISLPQEAVSVGDTWTMQASWMSLGEMVPYQLDMVSILKGFVACGKDRCADIEISGEVLFQGPISEVMSFKSLWKGRLLFDVDAGAVLWSRVDSDENFAAENVRREVSSCLESRLSEPADLRLDDFKKPACAARSIQ